MQDGRALSFQFSSISYVYHLVVLPCVNELVDHISSVLLEISLGKFCCEANSCIAMGKVACWKHAQANYVTEIILSSLPKSALQIFSFSSSDNGGSISHGGKNYPYRGGKGDLWEGGLKGVAFVSGPLVLKPGLISREFVHVSDWFPTLLWLAGVNVNEADVDGLNIWQAARYRLLLRFQNAV